jgi:hypothetical protein
MPLEYDAALQTFLEIADGVDQEEVDKVLSLTDNMPLAINLLAHLVDSEGCSNFLSRWEEEKTILISVGHDKRSNLDLSISLSLLSPRIKAVPGARELLSLLSILPDGLSDTELVQSRLPIPNILNCTTALIRTALAYKDQQKRIKTLVPIREYIHRIHPPGDHLIHPLLQYFHELLEFYTESGKTQAISKIFAQILLNSANIQNVIQNGLHPGHPDLINSIYCTCDLTSFSRVIGRGMIPIFRQIPELIPHAHNPRLEVYFISVLFLSCLYFHISNPQALISEALEHFNSFDDVNLKCMVANQ